MQGLVIAGLALLILVTGYILIKGDSIQKTGWLVYLISP